MTGPRRSCMVRLKASMRKIRKNIDILGEDGCFVRVLASFLSQKVFKLCLVVYNLFVVSLRGKVNI